MTLQQQAKEGVQWMADTIEQLQKERDYLDKRLAEFEKFAHEFIELQYDNVLRDWLEKILYNEKDGE